MDYIIEQVRVPVVVVGCMLDKRDEQYPVSLEQVMSPIMQQFREIETCIECSALRHIQVNQFTSSLDTITLSLILDTVKLR